LASGLSRRDGAKNVDIKVVVEIGDFAEIFGQAVKGLDLGLIVVGTHGRTGWRKAVLGSIAETVVDQASCPVLTVGPSADRTRIQEFGPENILLANGSPVSSSLAESYATSLATKYGSRLTVVDVLENRCGRVLAKLSQPEGYQPDRRDPILERASTKVEQLPI